MKWKNDEVGVVFIMVNFVNTRYQIHWMTAKLPASKKCHIKVYNRLACTARYLGVMPNMQHNFKYQGCWLRIKGRNGSTLLADDLPIIMHSSIAKHRTHNGMKKGKQRKRTSVSYVSHAARTSAMSPVFVAPVIEK